MKDRKNIRLRNYDYSSEGLYFITICTYKFLNLFGKIENELILLNDNGKIVEKLWMDIPDTYKNIKLHSYIIMPNHFHGNIEIVGAVHEPPLHNFVQSDVKSRRQMLIPKIVGKFKMQTSKQINILRNTVGKSVWQRNYYDHIIRNEESYNKITEYIENNPSKWEFDKYYLADIKGVKDAA